MIQRCFILLLGILLSLQGLYGERNRISRVSVQEKQGRIEVRVQGTQKPTFTVFKLKSPLRLIVDISNATISGLESPINVNNGIIKQIITSQFEDDVNVTSRMMLSLQKDSRYSVKSLGNRFILLLEDQKFNGSKRIVQNVQTELLEHGNEIQTIRQSLQQKEKILASKERELQKKEQIVINLKNQLDLATGKLKGQRQENQKLVSILGEKREELSQNGVLLNSLKKELTLNQGKINQKNSEMLTLKRKVDAGEAKGALLGKLEAEHAGLSKNQKQLHQRLKQEKQKQAQLESERKTLAVRLDNQKSIYLSLEKDYRKILIKNKSAWKNLQDAEGRNQILSKENSKLKIQLTELLQSEQELKELSKRAKVLDQQNKTLKAQLQKVAQGKNNLDQTVSSLKQNNETLNGENQKLSHKAMSLSKENEFLKRDLKKLLNNNNIKKAMATNRHLVNQTQKILSSNETLLSQNKKYSKEYKKISARVNTLSQSNRKLRKKLSRSVRSSKQQYREIASKTISLEGENQRLEGETKNLQQRNQQLKVQLQKMLAAKKQIAGSRSKLNKLAQEKQQLSQENKRLKNKFSKEKTLLSRENQLLRTRIEEVKSKESIATPQVNDLKVLKYKDKIVVKVDIKDYKGDFEILELDHPSRLVVELPNTTLNPSLSKNQQIKDHLLKAIRLGEHQNQAKIVFDIDEKQKMPRYFLKKENRFLSFTILTSQTQNSQSLVDLKLNEDKKEAGVVLKFDHNVKYSLVREDQDLAVVKFYNVSTPIKLQNALESTHGNSALKMASVFQSGNDTILAIKLNEKTRNNIAYDEQSARFSWSFQNRKVQPANLVKRRVENVNQVKYYPSETAAYSAQEADISRRKYHGKRISIDFKNADIHDVLQLIADVSKVNIITADNVSGSITMKLRNVQWDKALDVILKTKNLGKEVLGNIIRIAPLQTLSEEYTARLEMKKKAEENIPMGVRLIPVNYARAEELVEQIKNLLTEKRGTVSVDVRTNVLIVKDVFQKLDEAEALVRNLDTQTPQVLIEGRIVEASSTFSSSQGIQWGGNMEASTSKGNQTGLFFPSSVGVSGYDTDQWMVNLPTTEAYTNGGGLLNFSLGSINDALGLTLRLSAAEAEGSLKIISSPRISTLDNKEAMIETGLKIPIMTLNAQGVPTSKLIDAKITLKVTPHVTSDNSVILKLDLKKEEPDFSRVNQLGDPAIISKMAKTELILDNGETGVIGGMYTKKISKSEQRVPFLGSVPVLGWFFKSKSKADERSELLIFITPKIINRHKIMSSK